jgi:hypothetical protein
MVLVVFVIFIVLAVFAVFHLFGGGIKLGSVSNYGGRGIILSCDSGSE